MSSSSTSYHLSRAFASTDKFHSSLCLPKAGIILRPEMEGWKKRWRTESSSIRLWPSLWATRLGASDEAVWTREEYFSSSFLHEVSQELVVKSDRDWQSKGDGLMVKPSFASLVWSWITWNWLRAQSPIGSQHTGRRLLVSSRSRPINKWHIASSTNSAEKKIMIIINASDQSKRAVPKSLN